MKGRFNLINDIAETFGMPREGVESCLRFGETSTRDGASLIYFQDGWGYAAGRLKDDMWGEIKTPEKTEYYRWKVRKEAA